MGPRGACIVGLVRPPKGCSPNETARAPRRWRGCRRGGRRVSRARERHAVAAGDGELTASVTVLAVHARAGVSAHQAPRGSLVARAPRCGGRGD
jgi:hypothetical protein